MSRITGVVDAFGASAGRGRGEELWGVNVTLVAWRLDGGAVRSTPLRLHRDVTEDELDTFTDGIKASCVIAVDARLRESEPTTADFDAIHDAPKDPELEAILQQQLVPVTFEDPVLGRLTLDRRLDWFSGTASWLGVTIKIHIAAVGEERDRALQVAHALWADQAGWQTRISDYAVERLLELKNSTWLEEDEAPVTAENFKARLRLEGITAHPSGRFDFFHDDGDLFWGHAIEVSGSLEGGPDDADIPG